ncbi:MAG: DUF2177 family protein [Bauldia sp.]
MRHLVSYAATAVVFLGLDFVWLNVMSPSFYRPRLGALLLESPNIPVAAAFYVFYSAAAVALVVVPAQNADSWVMALALGAVLGAAAYGTYDITNLATIRGWSVAVTAVDIAWGAALTAVAALAGFLAGRTVMPGA